MSPPEEFNESANEIVESGAVYTIETLERITRISRDRIILYYRFGLVSPAPHAGERDLAFDEKAIHQLRRIAFLVSEYGINQEGLKMVSSLLEEVEKLREEVRFLRRK
jgi:DNA-binding transcriptional MerR regulator